MNIMSNIQSAFAAKVLAFAQANSLPIYFENQKYEPVLKQKHLQAFYLPADTAAAGCGEEALNKSYGLYQINVCTEVNTGYGPATTILDKIMTEFKRGTKMIKNGTEITVRKAHPEFYLGNESWYIIPVSIYFYAYSPNS